MALCSIIRGIELYVMLEAVSQLFTPAMTFTMKQKDDLSNTGWILSPKFFFSPMLRFRYLPRVIR